MAARRLSRIAVLAIPCLLSGCAGFYDEIFMNADGSGTYRLTVYVRKGGADGDLEAVRASVRDRAAKIAATAGFTLESVEVRRDGALLAIEVRAGFPGLSVFVNPALSVSADAGQWSFVVPREATFRDGRFVARVLRGSAPPRDHAVRATLKGHAARFSVHLPGEIVEANGQAPKGTANWGFSLDQLCDNPVEMIAVARSAFPFWSLGLGAAALAGLVVLMRSMFRRRRTGTTG